MFLWKVLSFSLAWGLSLCLDTAHSCSLEEKSTTVLHFHGVCCESKHHRSWLLGSCYMQDLEAMLGQRADSWPGLQCADLQTGCVLQRSCCRSSSEVPTSVVALSWITVRHLASRCQPTTAHSHSRPDVFLSFFFQQPHKDQSIPSSVLMHRTYFKVSPSF